MNAPNPLLRLDAASTELDQPTDFIWVMRGGGTDVYTTVRTIAEIQKRFPHNHLMELSPYILADSAGAYPASSLVVPTPVDPANLPHLFQKDVDRYLARDRTLARQALLEQIGQDYRLDECVSPICISTTDIGDGIAKAYFRFFPESYLEARPGILLPDNQRSGAKIADAVLASSAFAAYLGDYKSDTGRHMDMAFVETHSGNLSSFIHKHRMSCPDRRLVCVVFGNNYSRLSLGEEEQLRLRGLSHHFAGAIRAIIHNDILQHVTELLGPQNVVDLSLYVEQPFSTKSIQESLPHAFRSDAIAIRERIRWTEQRLSGDERYQSELNKIIAILQHQFDKEPAVANSHSSLTEAPLTITTHPPLTRIEAFTNAVRNYGVGAGLTATVVRELVEPVVVKLLPPTLAALKLAGHVAYSGTSWLGRQWQTTVVPVAADKMTRAMDFLLTGTHASAQEEQNSRGADGTPAADITDATGEQPLRLPSRHHS